MKYLILLSAFVLVACDSSNEQSKGYIQGTTYNNYELINIGKYECVGVSSPYGSGVWCNKTENKE